MSREALLKFASNMLKWTKYIPKQPTPKQAAFLLLPHHEAFFGGAAGGGKSEAILMGALQYVDQPAYSALILRKTLKELKGSEALLARARSWLSNTDATWVGSEDSWYFPTKNPLTGEPDEPARLEFGYIGMESAYTKYQGRAYQYVGWDELTHHIESDYLYLFSRNRKTVCPIHRIDENGNAIYKADCPLCQSRKSIPLRIRAASNPGGIGHVWVKNRYKIEPKENIHPSEANEKGIRLTYVGKDPNKPFIPSFVKDNPYLSTTEYMASLQELDPVKRDQLAYGDWDASPDSRFKRSWACYYSLRGDNYALGRDGRGKIYRKKDFRRTFITVDPAASSREGPGDEENYIYTTPSHSVISVWGLTQDFHLLWLYMRRFRKEIPEVIEEIKKVFRDWNPESVHCDAGGLGKGVYQTLVRAGIPVQQVLHKTDKVVNATEAIIRMEQRRIWLPQVASWLKECEDEIFSWTGNPKEPDDVVDSLADAARLVSWESSFLDVDYNYLVYSGLEDESMVAEVPWII